MLYYNQKSRNSKPTSSSASWAQTVKTMKKYIVILFVFATAQLSWAQTSAAPSKEWLKTAKEVVTTSNAWKHTNAVVPAGISPETLSEAMWADVLFAPSHIDTIAVRGDYVVVDGKKSTILLEDTVLQMVVTDLSVQFYIPPGVDEMDPRFLVPLYLAEPGMRIIKSYAPSGQGQDVLAEAKKAPPADVAKVANVEWVEEDKSFFHEGRLYQKNGDKWETEDPDAPRAIKAGTRKKDPTFIFSKNAEDVWDPVASNKRNTYKFLGGDHAGFSRNYYRHAFNGSPLGSAGGWGLMPATTGGFWNPAPMWGGGFGNAWGGGWGGGGFSIGFGFGWSFGSGWDCFPPPPVCNNWWWGGRHHPYPFMFSPMANGGWAYNSGWYGGGGWRSGMDAGYYGEDLAMAEHRSSVAVLPAPAKAVSGSVPMSQIGATRTETASGGHKSAPAPATQRQITELPRSHGGQTADRVQSAPRTNPGRAEGGIKLPPSHGGVQEQGRQTPPPARVDRQTRPSREVALPTTPNRGGGAYQQRPEARPQGRPEQRPAVVSRPQGREHQQQRPRVDRQTRPNREVVPPTTPNRGGGIYQGRPSQRQPAPMMRGGSQRQGGSYTAPRGGGNMRPSGGGAMRGGGAPAPRGRR